MVNDDVEKAILTQWQLILPSSVEISCGSINDACQSLTPLERQSLGDVDSIRLQEFSAGRRHAHFALEKLNVETTDIPKCRESGKPIWPAGITGTITHTSSKNLSHVAVAVASKDELKLLGIDAEIDLHIHPEIWQQFLTDDEFHFLQNLAIEQRIKQVNIIWCLKESAIKATEVFDMLSISTKALDSETGAYNIIANTPKTQIQLIGYGISFDQITLATAYAN